MITFLRLKCVNSCVLYRLLHILVLVYVWIPSVSAQTISTPAAFLGYTLGDQFTTHDRLIRYFEIVATQASDRCQLIPYGQTYEGRPLVVMVVASAENKKRLEEIRTNNLKITGVLDGTPQLNMPAIVWLSYNVHGNEAVSSEAVMEVLYQLLNPADADMQTWLKNTVVLLDPCLNPDGHERYVQWYKQVANQPYQPLPYAREHNEPWPGGRFNHYMFDLNRDWAWQTQQESQQRMVLYQQWMPHLHADFHEMEVQSPYYFAPSSKPYHQVLTPWQRQFQQYIGDANRKYFDKNYWLYYTRERFDLFYPSFGDTWPSFNGAIGMTYEQGGSGRAGLGIVRLEGDTLTLKQRMDHHVAASRASIEVVSTRAEQVVKEFKAYFDQARTSPKGTYKSYLIKTGGEPQRVRSLLNLLDRNGIQYGYVTSKQSASGFNYLNGKKESVAVEENDLVISAYQPKSVMLQALFEPNPTLEDSLTYDITSWAIPYAYGLQTYGLSERWADNQLSTKPKTKTAAQTAVIEKPYAYLATWKDIHDVAFLSTLLKAKVRVRNTEVPFEMNGKSYAPGTLLITRAANESLGDRFDKLVTEAAKKEGVTLMPVKTGFVDKGSDFGSDYVHFIKAPRIALLTGSSISPMGFGAVWHYFEQQIHYPVTVLDISQLGRTPLFHFDILILPSGSYSSLLTDRMTATLKDWIQAGGKVIAMEEAAETLGEKVDFEWKKKAPDKVTPKKIVSPTDTLKTYANRERDPIQQLVQGSIYRVTLDASHPLSFGYGDTYWALLQNGSTYELMKKGWNIGYLKTDAYVAGHVGGKYKKQLQNSAIFGAQEMGRGQVIYMAESPLFRAFWQNGKLLFSNALFMVGQVP